MLVYQESGTGDGALKEAKCWRLQETVANLSDAAEGNGQAWIVANSAGQIWFETGKAVDWLRSVKEFCPQEAAVSAVPN
jgi:hypothetical protein